MSGVQRRTDLDIPFDQRLQQQTHRTTIDYFTPLGKHLINKNIHNGRKRRRLYQSGLLRPDKSYITDLPPSTTLNEPVADICSKFVHNSTNKSKHAIQAIKWTPDARRILVSSYSGEFTLWNGLTFSFESIMQAHDLPIFSLEYSHNGKWLLSGDQSGCIKFWQPNFNNVNILSKSHENTVNEIKFSPNDSKFVSCSDDQNLKIWDFSTSKEERILKGHHWDVKSCDWHSSLGLVVSGSKDNLVKLWDPRGDKCISTINDFKHTVSKTAFQKIGGERLLAACSRDHSTRIFDLRMLRAINILKSEKDSDLTSLSWHPVHSTILTIGGYDGSLAHYNLNKNIDIETFSEKSQESKNEQLEMIRQINKLKETSNDDNLKDEISQYIFKNFANKGAPITEKAYHLIPFAHDKAIHSIEYHPLGHMLCTAGSDKSMRIWSRARPGDEISFRDHAHTGEDTVMEKTTLKDDEEKNVEVENTESLPGFSIPGFS